jgi:hypothetical protein
MGPYKYKVEPYSWQKVKKSGKVKVHGPVIIIPAPLTVKQQVQAAVKECDSKS